MQHKSAFNIYHRGSIKSSVIQAPFYYGKTIIITSSLCQRLGSGHQPSRQRRWTAGHYFNQTVISGWLDCIVFRLSSATLPPAYLFVCQFIWFLRQSVRQLVPSWLDGEGHSSHLGTVVQTRHSIHSDPWREGGHWQFTESRESICSLLELTLNTAHTPASHWSGMNT